MKRQAFLLNILVLLTVLALPPSFVSAGIYPKPTGFVSDFAKVLPLEVRESIEQKLRGYEKTTSIEIAVVTIPKLTEATAFDEAQKIGDDWGVGKKGKDNGLILLGVLERKYCLVARLLRKQRGR